MQIDSDVSNVVIFGATGDLSRRMLLPSLYSLDRDGLLPSNLKIVGAARSSRDTEGFKALARSAILERLTSFDHEAWARFSARLHYCKVDAGSSSDYETLAAILGGAPARQNHLFFLSLSPDNYIAVSEKIREAGLNTAGSRIVVEKPIGRDLQTCRDINAALLASFDESRIFRIDHYLGKETVQNILALRFANVLFEPLWNRSFIERVTITVFETVGVEGRWGYYDNYGALRDMVQNHVLQLLCLVAMEPPSRLQADAVRDEKVKVVRSLKPICDTDVLTKTVRGQYGDGAADGKALPGYAQEAGGKLSNTETFVAVKAEIDSWRWAGVPFILRTGKRMAKRLTEIEIQFRGLPHSPFDQRVNKEIDANRLTITLQPDEHVSLHLMNKWPGLNSHTMHMIPLTLDLSLTDAFHAQKRRIAYEQLLLDALNGRQTLFVRADETEAAWSWVDGIVHGWNEHDMKPELYKSGSNGPDMTTQLLNIVGEHPQL
jgi:glucose-6-phosphate 1-dehydrogenase